MPIDCADKRRIESEPRFREAAPTPATHCIGGVNHPPSWGREVDRSLRTEPARAGHTVRRLGMAVTGSSSSRAPWGQEARAAWEC